MATLLMDLRKLAGMMLPPKYQPFSPLLLLLLLLLLLASAPPTCSTSPLAPSSEAHSPHGHHAATGDKWLLSWSDEFEGSEINTRCACPPPPPSAHPQFQHLERQEQR
jgi:hypothetical protein